MNGKFAYSTVAGKLPGFLSKIREIGVPSKATGDWLKEIGYRSSNDRSMLTVLKFIGFIDSTNTPTQRWRDFRGADYRCVLAVGIREGYADLFATYPDAQLRDDAQLAAFFSARTDAGKQVVDKTVATFKALTDGADFSGVVEGVAHSSNGSSVVSVEDPLTDPPVITKTSTSQGSSLVVNINVQLTLPESTNGEVYRQFFTAMRDSLLNGEDNGD